MKRQQRVKIVQAEEIEKMNASTNHPPKKAPTKNERVNDVLYSLSTSSIGIKKVKRTWKKPKDKPMRPLSSYNMFFQNTRERIVAGKTGDPTPDEIKQSIETLLKSKVRGPKRRQDRISHGRISFGDLARTIADKWKMIDAKTKAIYDYYAGQEKARYKQEVLLWKTRKESEHDAKTSDKHANHIDNNIILKNSSLTASLSSSTSSSEASMSSSLSNSFFGNQSEHSVLNNSSDYSLFNTVFDSKNTNRLKAPAFESKSIMRQRSDDAVVRRQQNILRQQMGFKVNFKSQPSLTYQGMNVDEGSDKKTNSNNVDTTIQMLHEKKKSRERESKISFGLSDCPVNVGSNSNKSFMSATMYCGGSLPELTPLSQHQLQQQHQNVSSIKVPSTENWADIEVEEKSKELEKITLRLNQLKEEQIWMQQLIMSRQRQSSLSGSLKSDDSTLFACPSSLKNTSGTFLNQVQHRMDHQYCGLSNNANSVTNGNDNGYSSLTGSFGSPLDFQGNRPRIGVQVLSNIGFGRGSSSCHDPFQSTPGSGCGEQQQAQLSGICRNHFFDTEESTKMMIECNNFDTGEDLSNIFEGHSSCPTTFNHAVTTAEITSNHCGQEENPRKNNDHNSLFVSIPKSSDNNAVQDNSEFNNDDISVVSLSHIQDLKSEIYANGSW